jgi:DNA-binding GntR family transcriptional regulator
MSTAHSPREPAVPSRPPHGAEPAVRPDTGPETPLGRILVSDQVYEWVKAAITGGSYRPGDRLAEQEIARRLAVSQAPVREALSRLARERLVIQLPRRGSFVAEISTDDARHAYQVRIPLERIVGRLACEAGDAVVEELLTGLEHDLARLRSAAGGDDLWGVVEADASFHRRIWQATGNPLLPEVWAMVEGCIRGFTVVSNRLYYPDLPTIAETHRPLIDAVRARDADTAADLFEQHAINVWRNIDAET